MVKDYCKYVMKAPPQKQPQVLHACCCEGALKQKTNIIGLKCHWKHWYKFINITGFQLTIVSKIEKYQKCVAHIRTIKNCFLQLSLSGLSRLVAHYNWSWKLHHWIFTVGTQDKMVTCSLYNFALWIQQRICYESRNS